MRLFICVESLSTTSTILSSLLLINNFKKFRAAPLPSKFIKLIPSSNRVELYKYLYTIGKKFISDSPSTIKKHFSKNI